VAVWTISPDDPAQLGRFAEKAGLGFVMLSDPKLEVISRYGLVNPSSPNLPHPTALVVDRQGVIRYARVDEDFRHRPPAAELLAAVDALKEGGSGG